MTLDRDGRHKTFEGLITMLTSGRRELMDLDIWGRWPPALILFSKNAEHADATVHHRLVRDNLARTVSTLAR